MGILRGNARLLLDEARRKPFTGSLLQISRTLVFLTAEELAHWARRHRVELRPVEHPARSHDPRLARLGCIDDQTFFRSLGFREIDSLDFSDYEGATVLADLNRPLPSQLEGRFDTVFEAGSVQHVFHLPRVLDNLHRAVKPGGRLILAQVPVHNHVDHGFYQFSPTLFHDFFTANGYRIETSLLFEFSSVWVAGRLFTTPWSIYRYEPGVLDGLSYGGFGRRQAGAFFVVTKVEGATGDVIPQQSYYVRLWQNPGPLLGWDDDDEAVKGNRYSRAQRRLAALVRSSDLVARGVLRLKRLLRRLRGERRGRPPVIARY